MKRLTNSEKEIPTLIDNAEYWLQVYFKLKDYEDFEEIFREKMTNAACDFLSDKEEFGKWLDRNKWIAKKCDEWARAEGQGRLVKLPCKVGTDVYYILGIPNETPCTIDKCVFELSDIHKIGKTLFLTREEAEAKLKELRGSNE